MRFALPLLLANYVAFGAFIALRPSEAARLHEKDREYRRGYLSMSSADPYTYIAARPLYNWSEWHGGERVAVKLLVTANLPALFAAGAVTPVVGVTLRVSVYYGWSYVRGALFLLFATIQWLVIGGMIHRAISVRRRARSSAVIVAAIVAATSCSPCGLYRGDGDCGPIGSGYAVRFTPVPVDKPGIYTFRFAGLAPRDFVAGFRLTTAAGTPISTGERDRLGAETVERPNPLIEMALINERSEAVISERRRLREWTWWSDFATIRGTGRDVPLSSGGGTRFVRHGERPDRGWGTSFEPRRLGRYTLTIKVVEADPAATTVLLYPTLETYTGSL